MSIAQELPDVMHFFIQECPICTRMNRIIILGIYDDGKRREKYPDMGYSFCNCKNIFYTRAENITEGIKKDPRYLMLQRYMEMNEGENVCVVLPDPFFCEWGNDPYAFKHWNPRKHWIIWDKDQFEDEMKDIGFIVVSSVREFNVSSENPQTFKMVLKKP